jgi:hypothetical protein
VATEIRRIARSREESPAYSPDWRWQQVLNYQSHIQDHQIPKEEFEMPTWEDDDLVHRYFAWWVRNVAIRQDDVPLFRYATEAIDTNLAFGAAGRLRAMKVAGMKDDVISARFGTTTNRIHCFYRMFFEVDQYLDSDDFLAQIALPLDVPRGEPPSLIKQRQWMGAAYAFGPSGFDFAYLRKTNISPEGLELANKRLRALILDQGVEYATKRRLGGMSSPMDIETLNSYLQGSKDATTDNGEKQTIFTKTLSEVALNKIKSSITIHEAEMVVTRTAKVLSAPPDIRKNQKDLTAVLTGDLDFDPIILLN